MDIAAFNACFTCSIEAINYKDEEDFLADETNERGSIVSRMLDGNREANPAYIALRQFSEWQLGIGKWPDQKMYEIHIARRIQAQRVNKTKQHYSKLQMGLAILRITVLFPLTIMALMVTLVDYFAHKEMWIAIVNQDGSFTYRKSSYGSRSNVHTIHEY